MGACKAERAASTTRYFGVPESSLLSPGFPGAGGVGVVDGGAGWGAEAGGGAAGAGGGGGGCADGGGARGGLLSGGGRGAFFPPPGGVGVVDGGAGWGAEAEGGAAGAGWAGVGCADGVVTGRVFLSGRYSGPFCPQPAASHAAPSAARQTARLIRTSGACHAAPASRAPGGR